MRGIILDLCGGSGSWSEPYREAGYDVRLVTLPDNDVRTYLPPEGVHGILAAPPCTEFARCGARWWKTKSPQLLIDALEVVAACQRIIECAQPQWWALENPIGRLKHYLGEPQLIFDPWEFGDPWTKKTWIWGEFNEPRKLALATKPEISVAGRTSAQHERNRYLEGSILAAHATRPDWIHRLGPSKNRAALRSITPPGFARAFFEANP